MVYEEVIKMDTSVRFIKMMIKINHVKIDSQSDYSKYFVTQTNIGY